MIGTLSEDVQLCMTLLTANRHYALNYRTIALRMKGDIDMSAVGGEESTGASASISDAEVVAILEQETEVEIFVVDEHKTRQGGAFFKCLNLTNVDFENHMVYLKILIETTINITVCI